MAELIDRALALNPNFARGWNARVARSGYSGGRMMISRSSISRPHLRLSPRDPIIARRVCCK